MASAGRARWRMSSSPWRACATAGTTRPTAGSGPPGCWPAHPELARASIHVAAAAADEPAVRTHLAAGPGAGLAGGGPYGWPPLLYLAYARHDRRLSEAALLGTARVLLGHGADPNAGYLWHGLYPPFTAVTGALSGGETGQPQHRTGSRWPGCCWRPARTPTTARRCTTCSSATTTGIWCCCSSMVSAVATAGRGAARFGHTADSPAELLRGQLWWAIVHDMRGRARLLVGHGADLLTPYAAPGGRPVTLRTSHGRTPAEVAALNGSPALARWLVAQGAAAAGADRAGRADRRGAGGGPGGGRRLARAGGGRP